jgi:hypothetical protein
VTSVAGCFLVEVYTPDAATEFPRAVERVRVATRSLSAEGMRVRYRRALLVRGDDTCFHVLEAPSAEAAIEASRRAGLEVERIVEVVDVIGSPEDPADSDRLWLEHGETRAGGANDLEPPLSALGVNEQVRGNVRSSGSQ